jgi:hypothetical protein
VVVRLVVDDDRVRIIATMDDPMADMRYLFWVDASLFSQMLDEVGKCSGMVLEGANLLILHNLSVQVADRLEREFGRVRG